MITWHTIPCQGAVSVAYCRVGSTVLRRTTQPGVATEWARALVHADGDGLPEWLARIEDHEWLPIDRDEAARLLGVVTAETLTDEQIRALLSEASKMGGDVVLHSDCEIALGFRRLRRGVNQRERARGKVAAAFNLRLGWLP